MKKKEWGSKATSSSAKLTKPKVHIIVPFISLNNYVMECIIHTLKLDYDNYSLILLPDSEIILPKEISNNKHVKVLVTGKENISKKRNLGITTFSDCDYFAFIDSDAYPRRDWLRNAMAHFNWSSNSDSFNLSSSNSNNLWAVGGPNITPYSEPLRQRVVGNASKSLLISGTYCFRKRIAQSRFCNNLPTCNLIVSKEAMGHLKVFNEKLFTGEDIDLCTRIIGMGKKILYARKVVVFHHNRSLFSPFLKQRITWGLSVFKVMKEKPSFSNLFLFLPISFILFMVTLGVLSLFYKAFLYLFIAIAGFYLFVIIIESIRWSKKSSEIFGTFISIVLGNISPGLGSIWAVFRFRKSENSTHDLVRKIYRNFQK